MDPEEIGQLRRLGYSMTQIGDYYKVSKKNTKGISGRLRLLADLVAKCADHVGQPSPCGGVRHP